MKNKTFVQKVIYILTFPILIVIKLLIYFYKLCISPLFPNTCKFIPSCSTYFLQSVDEYGVFVGSFLGIKRIFKCNPWSKGGIDMVKPNIKGKIRWIL